jgi:hypothetical protein
VSEREVAAPSVRTTTSVAISAPPLQAAKYRDSEASQPAHCSWLSTLLNGAHLTVDAARSSTVKERAVTLGVAVEGVDAPEITLAGRRGVVAADELLVQTLQQLGHRQFLLRHTLRCYESPGCPSAAAPAASF